MMQPGYAFVVRCTVDPSERDTFVAAVNRHAARALRDEPGTLRFDVAIDPGDATSVYLYEAYRNEAAFASHLAAMQLGPQPWAAYFRAPPQRMCVGRVVPYTDGAA